MIEAMGSAPSRAKGAVLAMSMGFGALCLISAGYLALAELAVPPSLWLMEDRLFDASPKEEALVPTLAGWFPAQGVHSRHAACEKDQRQALDALDFERLDTARRRCVEAIEDALRWMPSSSELWFHHARLLSEAGAGDEDVNRSLRLSYRMGAREGWLAPTRLKFGLLRWVLLPAGLRANVERDAWTMLQSWLLLKRLARLHWSNPALRKQLDEVVGRQATPKQNSTLYWLVEKLAAGEPLP